MKTSFRGWTSVFGFTFRQSVKSVGFKLVTILISLLLIGILVATNILIAKPDQDSPQELEPSTIKTIYVLDQSGLETTDFKSLNPAFTNEQFSHINFISLTEGSREAVIQQAKAHSKYTLAAIITLSDGNYEFEMVIPSESAIDEGDAEAVLEPMLEAFQVHKLLQADLTEEQLSAITTPILTSTNTIGEVTNEIALVVQLLAPMLFSLVLYMMLIIHGQSVSKSVSTEKTSKLMETLLTSIHSNAMIAGKVLAVTSAALLQFASWILSIFIGLYGGNLIARILYPDYNNTVIQMIDFIRDHIGESALTLSSLAFAILFLCIGFLFYCVLAALSGSMVSKPEDTASTQALFMLPIIFSWLLSYIAPITENKTLISILRYVPLTSPFMVPADLLSGAMSIFEGVISLLLLLLFTLLTIMISARIYKGLVLYTGQKISFKTILGIFKHN